METRRSSSTSTTSSPTVRCVPSTPPPSATSRTWIDFKTTMNLYEWRFYIYKPTDRSMDITERLWHQNYINDLQLNYLLKKDTSHIIDSTRKEVVQALLVFFKFYFHIFPQEGFCFCFQFKFSLSTSLMNLSCYWLWLVDLIVVRSREECYERP